MTTGTEWLIDAAGCDGALLGDLGVIRALCDEIVAELDLCVVGEALWHQFPSPGGVTGMYLLTESHLTCHTFPEVGVATFNLYCCRPRAPWPWLSRLSERLGAAAVSVRRFPRGAASQPGQRIGGRLTASAGEGG
jgi:S-adenosylmethionine decarboxylase